MPEEYGFVALISVFTGFVLIFSDVGISFAIIRSDYGRTFHNAMNNLAFYIGLLLFVLMVLLAYPIAIFYDNNELVIPTIVLSVIFIFGSLKTVPLAILSKNLDFNYIGKVNLSSTVISILLMILFAFLGFSYWSLIIPNTILQLLQYLMYNHKAKVGFKLYNFAYTKAAFKKTKSLITNLSGFNIINYWARNADNLIIGKYYSSAELGIYDRAYKMLRLSLTLITGLFGTVLYPSLKKYKSEGGEINKEYESILGVISIINYPISFVLILFPNTFVKIMWGNNWMEVAELLPFFGVLVMFQTMISTTGHIFILLSKEKTFMYLGVANAIITIAAIFVGSLFSVKLIAISYTVCYVLITIPITLYIGFIKTFKYNWSYILKFWIPKLTIAIAILIVVLFELNVYLFVLMGIYLVHLLFNQRKDLNKLFKYMKYIIYIYNRYTKKF